jgi:hypothetical protein
LSIIFTQPHVNVFSHFLVVYVYILYILNDHTFLQIHINELWVHLEALLYFFAMGHFDWAFTKKS